MFARPCWGRQSKVEERSSKACLPLPGLRSPARGRALNSLRHCFECEPLPFVFCLEKLHPPPTHTHTKSDPLPFSATRGARAQSHPISASLEEVVEERSSKAWRRVGDGKHEVDQFRLDVIPVGSRQSLASYYCSQGRQSCWLRANQLEVQLQLQLSSYLSLRPLEALVSTTLGIC